MREFLNPAAVLFLASVLWGSAWIPLNAIESAGISHSLLLLLAYSVASVLTAVILWRQWHRVLAHWQHNKALLAGIFLVGGLANASFSLALLEGNVVRVMVLFYLLPVWSTLLGRLFLHETVGVSKALMIMLALLGVVLVAGIQPGSDWQADLLKTPWGTGDSLGLIAGFTYAANNILFRKGQQVALVLKAESMLLGAAFFMFLSWLWQADTQNTDQLLQVSASAVLLAILYGATWLLAVSFGSQWGVSHLPASRSSLIIIMELVTAVLTAWWLGEAQLSVWGWLGCACIMSAALLDSMSAGVSPDVKTWAPASGQFRSSPWRSD